MYIYCMYMYYMYMYCTYISLHANVHVHVLVSGSTCTCTCCTLGDCLISRPKGRSRPRELWFSIYSCTFMYMSACIGICTYTCLRV